MNNKVIMIKVINRINNNKIKRNNNMNMNNKKMDNNNKT